jgi:hypothetical protein
MLAELSRKHRRRRKSASLALSAAVATTPILPSMAAADGAGHASGAESGQGDGDGVSRAGDRTLLHTGSTGTLVSALQRRLNTAVPSHQLVVDGIFGPLTRGAVVDYERRHELRPTGVVDAEMWALLFDSPVLELAPQGAAPPATSPASAPRTAAPAPTLARTTRSLASPGAHRAARRSHAARPARAQRRAAAPRPVVVVSPRHTQTHRVSYMLFDGVALPLPARYLTGGYVDQGVDYSAPGGTPLFAMGDGVIIRTGMSGFGPDAPVLKITSGPLAGLMIYYGHSGPNSVRVGQRVRAGQRISQVGYGIVGISTGPHLEVGFYPPGNMGAGGRMLALINRLLHSHRRSHARATTTSAAYYHPSARSTSSRATYRRPYYSSSPSTGSGSSGRAHTTSARTYTSTESRSSRQSVSSGGGSGYQASAHRSSASAHSSRSSSAASPQRSTAPAPSSAKPAPSPAASSAPAAKPAADPAPKPVKPGDGSAKGAPLVPKDQGAPATTTPPTDGGPAPTPEPTATAPSAAPAAPATPATPAPPAQIPVPTP